MTTKHTPAPWIIDYGQTIGHIKSVRKNHTSTPTVAIYDLRGVSISKEQQYANAKLIAAAPELLEALKVYLQAGHKESRRQASVLAKAAINKAEGSEQ